MASMHTFLIHLSTMADCTKASTLIDWIYWTQTDSNALQLARKCVCAYTLTWVTSLTLLFSLFSNFQGVAGQSAPLRRRLLDIVSNMTCGGVHVSSVYGCIYQGTICSNQGACTNGACLCESGYEGQYCESATSTSSLPLAPILGSIIPAAVIALLVMACLIVALFLWMRAKQNREDEWEVDISEIEMGEQLGAGGYGEVHRAVWKGTDVAVKMMISEHTTRELERNFKEEVRVMTALRHPNVVLFMAASTKPPKMCIVMEFMALGSLYDVRHMALPGEHSWMYQFADSSCYHLQLLHNELIPDIPFALRNKMAYQAAKGLHFLHSSGIVHRDLKSLNLLLDSKWNVKVDHTS